MRPTKFGPAFISRTRRRCSVRNRGSTKCPGPSPRSQSSARGAPDEFLAMTPPRGGSILGNVVVSTKNGQRLPHWSTPFTASLPLSAGIAYHERGHPAVLVSVCGPHWETWCRGCQEMIGRRTSQRSREERHAAMLDAALACPGAREFIAVVEDWKERDRRLDAFRVAIAAIGRGRTFPTDRSLLVENSNPSRGES